MKEAERRKRSPGLKHSLEPVHRDCIERGDAACSRVPPVRRAWGAAAHRVGLRPRGALQGSPRQAVVASNRSARGVAQPSPHCLPRGNEGHRRRAAAVQHHGYAVVSDAPDRGSSTASGTCAASSAPTRESWGVEHTARNAARAAGASIAECERAAKLAGIDFLEATGLFPGAVQERRRRLAATGVAARERAPTSTGRGPCCGVCVPVTKTTVQPLPHRSGAGLPFRVWRRWVQLRAARLRHAPVSGSSTSCAPSSAPAPWGHGLRDARDRVPARRDRGPPRPCGRVDPRPRLLPTGCRRFPPGGWAPGLR